MKIMLSSVGRHDPYGGKEEAKTEGPILGAVQELQPDIIFLFPTRKHENVKFNSTEDNSTQTKQIINEYYPSIKVYEKALNLPDPTDYSAIIKQITEEVDSIKENYKKSNAEYVIALSSGTPQIHAAFLVIVNSNRIKADVYQTIEERFLDEGAPRTRQVEVHFLEEQNQIKRAKIFFDNLNFRESGNELTELALYTIYPERTKKAEVLSALINGYLSWDHFQHKDALEKLNNVLNDLKRYRFDSLYEIVKEQTETLNKITEADEKEVLENLTDLYHNALRRIECGQYVDCLNRSKRLFEGVYYYFARAHLNIEPNKTIDKQPEWVRRMIPKKAGRLNVYDIADLYIEKKGEPLAPVDLQNRLKQFGDQRNHTINNHGMKTVTRKEATDSLDLISKLYKKLFDKKNIDEYCFSKKQREQISELIFSIL